MRSRIRFLIRLYFQFASSSMDTSIATAIIAVPTPITNMTNHRYKFILMKCCKNKIITGNIYLLLKLFTHFKVFKKQLFNPCHNEILLRLKDTTQNIWFSAPKSLIHSKLIHEGYTSADFDFSSLLISVLSETS